MAKQTKDGKIVLGTATNSLISLKDKNMLHSKLLVLFPTPNTLMDQFGNTIICTVSQLETDRVVNFQKCIIFIIKLVSLFRMYLSFTARI